MAIFTKIATLAQSPEPILVVAMQVSGQKAPSRPAFAWRGPIALGRALAKSRLATICRPVAVQHSRLQHAASHVNEVPSDPPAAAKTRTTSHYAVIMPNPRAPGVRTRSISARTTHFSDRRHSALHFTKLATRCCRSAYQRGLWS